MNEFNNYSLMLKDKIVINVNMDNLEIDVLEKNLLPFYLRDSLLDIPEVKYKNEYLVSKEEMQQSLKRTKLLIQNKMLIDSFISSRALPINRVNAKHIYNTFGYCQLQSIQCRMDLALGCRALNLQDNYWVHLEGDPDKWNDIDFRKNSISTNIADISLNGSYIRIKDKVKEVLQSPELTGQGAYAKAWIRESDGLYLYKKGFYGDAESRIEVMVSNLLDNCNVNHLKYEAGESNGEYICKCKCMTDDTISILSGMDFDTWCTVRGVDSHKEALKIDPDSIYKMWIVDYLISNRDRHGLNWGFFYNCDTMEILGCHPLYDHNNSFDIALMQDENAGYLYDDSMTMKEAAMKAMKEVDFHFYRVPVREDFITDRQYKTYMKRAEELGIKVIPKEQVAETDMDLDIDR